MDPTQNDTVPTEPVATSPEPIQPETPTPSPELPTEPTVETSTPESLPENSSAPVVMDTAPEPQTQNLEMPAAAPASISSDSQQATLNKKKKLKLLGVVLALVLLVGGGSAAAYFGVIVPNKPENVLKSAIITTLQEKQVGFKGSFEEESGDSLSVKSTISGSLDSSNKSGDVLTSTTFSGVTLPFEVRFVDKNLYLKAGDLTPLASLAAAFSPSYGTMAKTAAQKLSNKWIVVDSKLLKQAGGSCILDLDWSLTKGDIQLLQDQYKEHPFTMVKSTASDTVGGKKVTKMELNLDDNKLAGYSNGLNSLSFIKAANTCSKGSTKPPTAKGDGDYTPVTVWIDKTTKHIVQISSHSTPYDLSHKHLKASGTVTLNYDKVSIKAPEGAEPALQLIAELESSLGKGSVDPLTLFAQ